MRLQTLSGLTREPKMSASLFSVVMSSVTMTQYRT